MIRGRGGKTYMMERCVILKKIIRAPYPHVRVPACYSLHLPITESDRKGLVRRIPGILGDGPSIRKFAGAEPGGWNESQVFVTTAGARVLQWQPDSEKTCLRALVHKMEQNPVF